MVNDHKEEATPSEKTVDSTRHTLPTFYEPEGFSAVYSDNAVVMHTENEFILSFFLADFPYPSNTAVDVRDGEYEYASPVKSARARCVARVIMSPSQTIQFVDALKSNLQTFLERVNKAEVAQKAEEEP